MYCSVSILLAPCLDNQVNRHENEAFLPDALSIRQLWFLITPYVNWHLNCVTSLALLHSIAEQSGLSIYP